jgi:hypothetical protein
VAARPAGVQTDSVELLKMLRATLKGCASAHIGRVFGPSDEVPGFAEAAVISDSLWASAEHGKIVRTHNRDVADALRRSN